MYDVSNCVLCDLTTSIFLDVLHCIYKLVADKVNELEKHYTAYCLKLVNKRWSLHTDALFLLILR